VKYRPMKASPPRGVTVEGLVATGWVAEEKIDGVRAIVEADGTGPVKILSRSGQPLNRAFPEIVAGFGRPDVSFVLDGELQLWGQRFGDLQFKDLLSRVNTARPGVKAKSQPAVLRAFDLLEVNGHPLVRTPLYDRRNALDRVAQLFGPDEPFTVLPQGGLDLVDLVQQNDRAEGVILKREDSIYLPGIRAKSWLKFKRKHTITCIAFDYAPSSNPRRPLGAVTLVLLDGATPTPIGVVGSGMTERDMVLIRDSIDRREFLIVEVSVLGKTDDGLREPSFLGIRQDMDVLAAGIDQLSAVPAL
jgi:bifunctional non-homologous end joining protein LigD